MILVAVVKDNLVKKLYKTSDSLDAITKFLKTLHPKTDVIEVDGNTGFPVVGGRFDGNKFLGIKGE